MINEGLNFYKKIPQEQKTQAPVESQFAFSPGTPKEPIVPIEIPIKMPEILDDQIELKPVAPSEPVTHENEFEYVDDAPTNIDKIEPEQPKNIKKKLKIPIINLKRL